MARASARGVSSPYIHSITKPNCSDCAKGEGTSVRLTGEDSLSRPMSETAPMPNTTLIPFEIRFHLHPDVQVANGPDDRTVFLGLPTRRRVWRFRSETLLSIENSRYWSSEAARKTRQLVIRGVADPGADGSQAPNRVRWALTRVEPGVSGGSA